MGVYKDQVRRRRRTCYPCKLLWQVNPGLTQRINSPIALGLTLSSG